MRVMVLKSIPAMLIRGGTSKGVFFAHDHLPMDDPVKRDKMLLNMFGSPDPNQVDGIGGGHGKASKAFVVSTSSKEGIDLEYTVGQVGIEQQVVDWRGNSGNVTHAVGCFALERGYIQPEGEGSITLKIENTNTGVLIDQKIQVRKNGDPIYEGDFKIPSLPNSAAPIKSDFLKPGGAITGELFPTGTRKDTLNVQGVGEFDATILDVTNPVIFINANVIGLDGTEHPTSINDKASKLSEIRNKAAVQLGFAESTETASKSAYNTPMLVLVGERTGYELIDGSWVDKGEYDLLARHFNLGSASSSFAMTSAMCTGAAGILEGTIVSKHTSPKIPGTVRLGTPTGVLKIRVDKEGDEIQSTGVTRSARKIMDGLLYYEI